MESIDLIRENLQRSEDLVLRRIEDMRAHCTVVHSGQLRIEFLLERVA